MAVRVVRVRRLLLIATLFVGAACQGSDPSTQVAATMPPSSDVAASESASSTTTVSTTTDTAERRTTDSAPAPAAVTVAVTVAGEEATLTGLISESGDPFGRFVSCSGSRAAFGPYSVLASDPGSAVRSVSVITGDLVAAAGIHDAAVRVEFADRLAIDATGTITLAPDFRSGSLTAFDQDGTTVEGTFACSGDIDPERLATGSVDGVLEAVEVFALLRAGDEQRLVGLGAVAGDGAELSCPSVGGEPDGSLVRVRGEADIGAIHEFVLSGGEAPTLTMRVGTTDYAFSEVTADAGEAPGSGSFSGTADGISVDGAYRCS